MDITDLMETSVPELRKLIKKHRFDIQQDPENGWMVTYNFKEADEFHGAERKFNLPFYLKGETERVAMLYLLRRFVD
jgi:hypothetical protein